MLDLVSAADTADWYFDWDPVIRQCAPEVLIVMSGSRQSTDRIPTYAVVPRTGLTIKLSTDRGYLEQLSHGAILDAEEFDHILNKLKEMISHLPEVRVGEAMKHLNALRRIIKPTF